MPDTAWFKLWQAIEERLGADATAALKTQYSGWVRQDTVASERIKRRKRLARHRQELAYTTPSEDRRRWVEQRITLDEAWLVRHEEER